MRGKGSSLAFLRGRIGLAALKRVRPKLFLGALAVVAALLVFSGVAFALHGSDLFELDGNADDSPVGAPFDWVNVFNNHGGGVGTPDNADISTFVHDGPDPDTPVDTTYFTTGGSKDDLDVPSWRWTTQDQAPDKDELLNAYAAAFTTVDDELVIFFGADRYANNGSANVGFWFFKDQVGLNADGTFSGVHSVGDIFVVSEFTGGGAVSTINVYEWVGPGNGDSGSGNALLLLDSGEDCSALPSNPDDIACAIVNSVNIDLPWSFTPKFPQSAPNTDPPGSFFEGAVNISELLFGDTGGDAGCFSGFLAETRSSFAVDAQLKDFALGSFALCDMTVTKTGDTLSKVGDPVDYTITIANTGQGTLYKRNISDTLLGAITTDGVDQANAYVLTNTCGASLDAGASCAIALRRTVQAGDPDPLPNTVNTLYSEHADFTGQEFTRSDDHSVNLFQPAVQIAKTGDGLSKVTDQVNYTFTITNMSSQDSPNLTLASINDDVIGSLMAEATAAGCDVLTYNEVCSFSLLRTVLAGDADPLVNTVDVLYHPVGFPNDITAADGHSVNLFQPSVSIEKTGNELSKIGDGVTYHFKITNTGSADSPALVLDSISDDVLGNLAAYATAAGCGSIAAGASCEFDVPWTVAAVDIHPADGQSDDPVINTVTIHFHPSGFPNDITATASHELNLFQPSIAFDKSADTQLSKVTDDVNYTLTLNNTSSADSPDLVCTITDALLGVNKQVTLAAGGGDVTNVAYTVPSGAADPLVNTASVSCSPEGFPNILTASDGWSVNLFQPSVRVDKSGDALSKIGDDVTYHYRITNTSSADSPDLMLDEITDDVVGGLTAIAPAACDNMAPGDVCDFDVPWTVLAGSPDPLVNTVVVHYHPVGFPNDISDTDSHSLNLFQPSVTLTKTGPAFSKAGDTATYNVTIQNTSSADSPDLELASFTDSVVASVTPPAACDTLASGASCAFSYNYVVQAGDPDPLVNTATVHYNPAGFPNDITASSSSTTDLLHPSFTVTKVCKVQPVPQAGPAVFTISFNNTGDADLHVVPSEGAPFDVAAGQTYSYDYAIAGSFSASVNNTVTGLVTLAPRYALSNSYTFSASGTCTVFGRVNIVKTVSGQPPAAGQTFTFQLREGASTASDGTILETKVTDASGNISFATNLVPGQTYQICEQVFPGWNTNLTGDGPLFVPNSIIPPALPNPNVNNLTVCANFTVASGQTRTFTVDNSPPPGGRALTIGFWKNWSSCANSNGKGQKPVLDQTLAMANVIGDNTDGHSTLPGIVLSATSGSYWQFGPTYYLVIHGNPATPNTAPDCLKAVRLLDKSTINTGKKMASDPAFNLAAQLLAAQLNFTAGAGQNGPVIMAVNQAVLLLGKYQFNGITHTNISKADATTMNNLATILDNYNNNF